MAEIRGGQRLERELARLTLKLNRAGTLNVGFLVNARYPNGQPVAMVAAIQEYGAPGARFPIPPRPFFRPMVRSKSKAWPAAVAALLKQHDYDAQKALAVTGDAIAGQLRQSIIDVNAPPLSPVTLMLRKMFGNQPHRIRLRDVFTAIGRVQRGQSPGAASTKPLVWTGLMLGSVDYEVK
jgi:hypothetical protein